MESSQAPPGLLDVLYIVAAYNKEEGNAAVGISRGTWTDTRIWSAIVDMQHSPKAADESFGILASRLYIASSRGQLEVVRRLLDFGAKIDAQTDNGSTALHAACRCGHMDLINHLLNCHADINALNCDNESVLYIACYWANVEVARLLLERGADVDLGIPPILIACMLTGREPKMSTSTLLTRQFQVVQLLVEGKANLNLVDRDDGYTALMFACRNNQVAIITLLCDAKADINMLNYVSESALSLACYFAHVDAVIVLLDRGADVDLGLNPPILNACSISPVCNQSAIELSAFQARQLQVVRALIAHCANFSVANGNGWTAMMLASRNNQTDIINLLCDGNADINVLNNEAMSALGIAVYWANIEAARALLARGANIAVGYSPILISCVFPDKEDQREIDMSTFWARRCESVIELVRHNANLAVTTPLNGYSPLFLASSNQQWGIVAVLSAALNV